jgi:hypothetical protein
LSLGTIVRDVPFFFIAPIWLLLLVAGIVMVFIRSTRRLGIYVIVVPTTATLIAFLLSTAILFAAPRLFSKPNAWLSILTIGGYIAAIPIGGFIGAVAGWFGVRKALPTAQ